MKLTLNKDNMLSMALCLFAAYAVMLLPADALAQVVSAAASVSAGGTGSGGNPISKILCTVVNWFLGPVGGGIATLAILIVGIGALMGKVSWGMAIIVGIGVGVIFGAPTIVSMLGGQTC